MRSVQQVEDLIRVNLKEGDSELEMLVHRLAQFFEDIFCSECVYTIAAVLILPAELTTHRVGFATSRLRIKLEDVGDMEEYLSICEASSARALEDRLDQWFRSVLVYLPVVIFKIEDIVESERHIFQVLGQVDFGHRLVDVKKVSGASDDVGLFVLRLLLIQRSFSHAHIDLVLHSLVMRRSGRVLIAPVFDPKNN